MTSPYLDKPLRSEAEAQRDKLIIAKYEAELRVRDAAPDLLAALEALVVSIAPFESMIAGAIGNTSMPAMKKTRAAIAKARNS